MGGAGPAFGPDGGGNDWIYLATANGTFDQTSNYGGCSEQSPPCVSKPNGILYAFDALSLTQLYSSSTCQTGADLINQATKFSVPTVANGYVYVGTQSNNTKSPGMGTFYVFGPLVRSSC